MSLLKDKKILLTGVLSNRSIAYGIAKACHREGAQLAFTYQNERFLDRITGFAKEFDSDIVLPLDVADDAQIFALAETLKNTWGTLDGVVHSIGFAPREAIQGDFLDGLSRDAFKTALDISAYSFPALVKALVPLMEGHPSSVLTLTYLGSERVVPNYNTMGVAKAALEASVRYLANSLGPKGIRANAISSGPIKTLAASGIKDFSKIAQPLCRLLQKEVTFEFKTFAAAGISFSGVISARFPSASSAQSNIPSERTPASFAGFRFTRTITFFPTISSGV